MVSPHVGRVLPHPITIPPEGPRASGDWDMRGMVFCYSLRLVRRWEVLPHTVQKYAETDVAAHVRDTFPAFCVAGEERQIRRHKVWYLNWSMGC